MRPWSTRFLGTSSICSLAVVAVVASGCGEDDGRPTVPAGAVATVGDTQIDKRDLNRQVDALIRAQRQGRSEDNAMNGRTVPPNRDQLELQALSTMLQRQAIEQEAAEREVTATSAEIRRRWREIVRNQFKTRRSLRRFLAGQPKRQVLAQLRTQTLVERIHAQVRREADGDPDEAVEQFQKDFDRRWAESTACREGYAAPACAD